MARSDVIFATITLARTAAEGVTLARSLAALVAYGRPVIAADGGSMDDALQALAAVRGLELVKARQASGLVPQVKSSLDAASRYDSPFICYTEPDKHTFFSSGLAPFLDAAPAGDDVGVVLAARSAAAFETFPPLQQYAERAINDLVGEVTGVRGDYSYGPFLISRRLVQLVSGASPELGWGWRHFVFITAHRLGLRVTLIPGEYECPPEQRHEDGVERMHRIRQLEQNSRGLLAALEARLP